MRDDTTLFCSFCKKSQREVATLIAGPAHRGEGLFVCDQCVDMLAGIVAKGRDAAPSINLKEERPFYRVFHLTKQEAAAQQIEAAIAAFHAGQFAVAITLTGAAEAMASKKPGGGLWQAIRDHSGRPVADRTRWINHLNATRDWLKHDQEDKPTRNLVAFEAGLFIVRAMDKWEPWSPSMRAFKELWDKSPKLMDPDDYAA